MADRVRPPGPGRGAQTSRGERRRDLVVTVAAQLFAANGYDGVSMHEIGSAAGITGPAIYRYFPGKEDILISIFLQLYGRSLDAATTIEGSTKSPEQCLEALVDMQIELAAGHPEMIRIVDREARHLPVDAAKAFAVDRRRILRTWTDIVQSVRPDLDREVRDVSVHGVLALINSISLRRSAERASPQVCGHLRTMALIAILGASAE